MLGSSSYAGEPFLSERLPNYELERIVLVLQLVLAFVFWIVVVPMYMSKEVAAVPANSEKKQETSSSSVKETKNDNSNNKSSRKKSTRVKKGKDSKPSTSDQTKQGNGTKGISNASSEETAIREIDPLLTAFSVIGFLGTVVWIMLKVAPDNYYTGRAVFEAPLFTRDECNHVIDMAEQAAHRNFQKAESISVLEGDGGMNDTLKGFMQEPLGWQKKRHDSYPTTDLNLITDPFTKADRAWLKDKLDARLAPTIARLFGIPPGSIRAEDIFVVRYDGDRQASLSRHTDSGDVTFSTLLSEGFEGGGTRYWNRFLKEPFLYLLPEIGKTTLFPAVIMHEGVPVEEGRRYLLIGFLSVDKVDPFTQQPTGMSWFATWGSLNWASVKFKSGYESARHNMGNKIDKWTNQKYVRGFFAHMIAFMTKAGDRLMPHLFINIVQENRTDEFLQALDDAYATEEEGEDQGQDTIRKASWFMGQLTSVDIDGTINSFTKSRRNNKNAFEEDQI